MTRLPVGLSYAEQVAFEGDIAQVSLSVSTHQILNRLISQVLAYPEWFYSDYTGNEDDINDSIELAIFELNNGMNAMSGDNVTVWGNEETTVSGGTPAITMNGSQIWGWFYSLTTPVINNQRKYKVWLRRGIYNIDLWCLKTSTSGFLTPTFDSVGLTTIDLYAAATVFNVRHQLPSIHVEYDGTHELQLDVPSKNASSSGYQAAYTMFNFIRLSDL